MIAIESSPNSNSELSSESWLDQVLGHDLPHLGQHGFCDRRTGVFALLKTNGHPTTPFGCVCGRSAGLVDRRPARSKSRLKNAGGEKQILPVYGEKQILPSIRLNASSGCTPFGKNRLSNGG